MVEVDTVEDGLTIRALRRKALCNPQNRPVAIPIYDAFCEILGGNSRGM